MNIRFDGKRVAVSGAARGFGRHIAARFAALGAKVHGCDIAESELAETSKLGVTTKRVDLTDSRAATDWIGGIEVEGPLDILVNNAGGIAGATRGPIEDVSDEEWDRLYRINVDSTETPLFISGCAPRARASMVTLRPSTPLSVSRGSSRVTSANMASPSTAWRRASSAPPPKPNATGTPWAIRGRKH